MIARIADEVDVHPRLHSSSFFVRRLPVYLHQHEVVRSLLRGMFHYRMESRRGLDLWKGDTKRLLKSMATHEQDSATRDKLEMLCETARESTERAFVLDLVVWRTSCTRIKENSSSKQGALNRESAGGVFYHCEGCNSLPRKRLPASKTIQVTD